MKRFIFLPMVIFVRNSVSCSFGMFVAMEVEMNVSFCLGTVSLRSSGTLSGTFGYFRLLSATFGYFRLLSVAFGYFRSLSIYDQIR